MDRQKISQVFESAIIARDRSRTEERIKKNDKLALVKEARDAVFDMCKEVFHGQIIDRYDGYQIVLDIRKGKEPQDQNDPLCVSTIIVALRKEREHVPEDFSILPFLTVWTKFGITNTISYYIVCNLRDNNKLGLSLSLESVKLVKDYLLHECCVDVAQLSSKYQWLNKETLERLKCNAYSDAY